MPISRLTAQRLCTKPEFELVEASFPARAKQLTPGRLRQKVVRARKLRDKYRDLAKRQRLEARGKRAPQRSRPAQGNENTDRKAQLFQETLDRFETQLRRTDGPAPDRVAKKPGVQDAGARKTGARKAGAKKASARKPGAKKTGARKAGAKKAGARKAGAGKTSTAAPPAQPANVGPAAKKGGRQDVVRGPGDEGVRARARTARSHARSSNRRSQGNRDRRN